MKVFGRAGQDYVDTVSRLFSECDVDNSGIFVALPCKSGVRMVVHLSEQRRAFVSGNVNWEDSQNSAGEGCHLMSLLGSSTRGMLSIPRRGSRE